MKSATISFLLVLGLSIQSQGFTDCCCGHACPVETQQGNDECPGSSCTHLEASQKADVATAPSIDWSFQTFVVPEPGIVFVEPDESIPPEIVDSGPPLYLAHSTLIL